MIHSRGVHYLVSSLLYRVAREVGQTWQVGQALANVTASILHLQVCVLIRALATTISDVHKD
jgi:hypothetical protein